MIIAHISDIFSLIEPYYHRIERLHADGIGLGIDSKTIRTVGNNDPIQTVSLSCGGTYFGKHALVCSSHIWNIRPYRRRGCFSSL